MADTNTVVHIGENSPEQVAFKLLQAVADVEGKLLYSPSTPSARSTVADRAWILDTFAECLLAVRAPYERQRD